jgi:glycosyltransferase involved in cell wall biosynthesis
MCSVLRGLARLGPVDVFVLTDEAVAPPPGDLTVRAVERGPRPRVAPTRTARLRWTVSRRPSEPSELVGLDPTATSSALAQWVGGRGVGYDLVWFNRPATYLATVGAVHAAHIIDLDDLEDRKLAGRLEAGALEQGMWSGPRVPGWKHLVRHKVRRNIAGWRRLQSRLERTADRVVLCSDEDRLSSGLLDASIIPNCYPTPGDPLGRREVGEPPTLLLVGLMTYRPNADAATWFVERVFPAVRAALPHAEVRIVGEASATVASLGTRPGVTVTGRVEEIEAELRTADVVVVPVRFGGGTRLKVLEAWAHRIPVVSTTVGASGLGARDGEHLLVADEPEAFAAACVKALVDGDLRRGLVAAGADRHSTAFSCPRVEAEIADLASGVVAHGSPPSAVEG